PRGAFRPGTQHVVITGRNAPRELLDFGCFTLDMSVTRSAKSSSSRGAFRPVITTCWVPGRPRSTSTTSPVSTQPQCSGYANSSSTYSRYRSAARSRLTCSQPSRALASLSSCASRCTQDQPSPILCQSTVPPSPESPSTRSARSSPTFHFADLTNWNTPTGQPWFQARSASPKAAVDLPLPTPVC